jgi:16S rRNA (uracil1498-N3)-methyltransferase
LDGAEGRHAAAVRRIRAGELIDVGDGTGRVATCAVVAAAKDRLELRIDQLREVPQPAVRLVLVQALAKGGRDEQAVETATETGVDAVVPWQAARSIVWWDGERGEKARRRWETTAREAAKQSRRPWVPAVETLHSTPQLTGRVARATVALVLHETATEPITGVPLPVSGEVLVVVGPEGGITDDELARFTSAGALTVRLGMEVLRASTAGPLALAYLASQLGRWEVR